MIRTILTLNAAFVSFKQLWKSNEPRSTNISFDDVTQLDEPLESPLHKNIFSSNEEGFTQY